MVEGQRQTVKTELLVALTAASLLIVYQWVSGLWCCPPVRKEERI